MIAGFVRVDPNIFYANVWPQINAKVDAVQSNLPKFKLGEDAALVIRWGYKDAGSGEM